MRLELRDEFRRRIGRIDIDPARRPTRVMIEGRRHSDISRSLSNFTRRIIRSGRTQTASRSPSKEVFLNWDTAVDDSGQLRKCVACGCADLFKEKAFPQVTAFVVALAFIGAVIGALGLATNAIVLFMMAVVLVFDIGILLFSQRRLVCYQCRSTYHKLPIARYHRSWDRATADRHPALSPPEPELAQAPPMAEPAPVAPDKGYFA